MKKYLLIILFFMPSDLLAIEKISNLVMPVSYSINRTELLTDLKKNLAQYGSSSIVGISGIGKTQLARMYAYQHQNQYNIIWFIDCSLDINEEFLKLAQAVNQSVKSNLISENLVSVKNAVMDYLTHQDNWLIVFDNLRVRENNKIKEFVSWEHNGNVIFCAQDMEIVPNVIKIKAFNQNDSITLANDILVDKDHESAKWLAQELKGYPILIAQGAQLLNNIQGLDKEEYKKRIQQSSSRIKSNITLAINQLSPSAKELVNKIALINNQSFSKDFLSFIHGKTTLDSDIYQLCKFMLISNTSGNVFEMHDAVAQIILELNINYNRKYLTEIISSFLMKTQKRDFKISSRELYSLYSMPTILENLKTTIRNSKEYQVSAYLLQSLKNSLLSRYLNDYDMYNAENMIGELINRDDSFLKMWLMNDEQKSIYARSWGLIGSYHKKNSDFSASITFFTNALKILNGLNGYFNLKYNYTSNIIMCNILLGNTDVSSIMDKMKVLAKQGVNQFEIDAYENCVEVMLLFINGRYNEALEKINQDLSYILKHHQQDDPLLTELYLLRSSLLNYAGIYEAAYAQAQQVYNIHKYQIGNSRVFGNIFANMARATLGLGNISKALEYNQKAIGIFLTDNKKNPISDYIDDPDLATSYVTKGDIAFTLDNLQIAIQSYRKAQEIYSNLYKKNSKNVAHVSYLYLQGAKAACKKQDLFFYKAFGKFQVKEFGIRHSNSTKMLKYCKAYNMDLWSK